MLIDSHTHLDDRRFQRDIDKVLERAKEAGVSRMIHVGADKRSSISAYRMAEKHENIYAVIGVHPHSAKHLDDDTLEFLYDTAKRRKKIVAIGEIGLDYYRNLSPQDQQKTAFVKQIALAKELDLPIVIHDRDAHRDTVKVMKEENAAKVGGVLHCFAGDRQMARECLGMGFYLSFAGPVTFSRARQLVDVVAYTPLERILIETDCPYLTPTPHRGKRNEPAYVKYVAERIAEIKGISFEEVAKATTENTEEVFRLK